MEAQANDTPKKLIFRPFVLKRSTRTTTQQELFSANVSDQVGARDARIEMYLNRTCFRDRTPECIRLMFWTDQPVTQAACQVVLRFALNHFKQPQGPTVRYDISYSLPIPEASKTVYVPRAVFRGEPPETVWMEVTWTKESVLPRKALPRRPHFTTNDGK